MPVTASEIQIYDEEALTVRSTSSALARARSHGLCVNAGRYWVPSYVALDLRGALEDRYLAEVGQATL
jgi:malate synthase